MFNFIRNIKISTKLLWVSVASVVGLAMLSGAGIRASLTGIDALKTIYEKNVLPQNDITHAKIEFDTILNDLIHVTSEFLPTGQARDRIYKIQKNLMIFLVKQKTMIFLVILI